MGHPYCWDRGWGNPFRFPCLKRETWGTWLTQCHKLFRLVSYSEQRLEVRRFCFFVYDGGEDIQEAGLLNERLKFHFAESQPKIGVKFAGFFKTVLAEIENGDAPAGLEDAPCFGDRTLGMNGVVQGLAE